MHNPGCLVIDGPLRREIREALVGACHSKYELRALVCESLRAPLAEITSAGSLPEAAFDAIQYAAKHGKLADLVSHSAADKPTSEQLTDLAARFQAASASGIPEVVIRKNIPFEPAGNWNRKLASASRAVCRIDWEPSADTEAFGTGFLIAPDVILTASHVVKEFLKPNNRKPKHVTVRFDFEYGHDGVSVKSGKPYKLANKWLLFDSDEEDLDFSLIRLKRPAGDEIYRKKRRRGWLKLVSHDFVADEPLFILQHAEGKPLTLSPGLVVDVEDGNWMRHNVNTKGGSSGSPCLTFKLQVAAIHHWGFKAYNRAVRCAAILNRLNLKPHKAKLKKLGLAETLGLDV